MLFFFSVQIPYYYWLEQTFHFNVSFNLLTESMGPSRESMSTVQKDFLLWCVENDWNVDGHANHQGTCTLHFSSFDECCRKIDLFRVQNSVVHILLWWKYFQVYQTEVLFPERWSNFWLFLYQIIYDRTSNRINTQFGRPKIHQFFSLEQLVNFRMTLIICVRMFCGLFCHFEFSNKSTNALILAMCFYYLG